MKKKIVWKLAACFGASLLIFALITGSVFIVLFRQHTIKLHKNDMFRQAKGVAETFSIYQEFNRRDLYNNKHYLDFLDELMLSDTWLIDDSHRLITHGSYGWEDLTDGMKTVVDHVLAGQASYSEEFSSILNTPVMTVGVPVYNRSDGGVMGGVLLHSPVDGIDSAVSQGLYLLGAGILAALILAFVLSLILSYGFTRPLGQIKDTAVRLADGEYQVKTGVSQRDEIGSLARSVDRLAGRLKEAEEERGHLEQMRRDFITSVSHELRTPVTVLRGSVEALQDGIVTDPEQIKLYYSQMFSESIYLERMVDDLLELSRLQNPDFQIEMSPVNVCDVISDVNRAMRRAARKKSLTVIEDILMTECWIDGDYGRIRQMLLIVLDNAIKFSDENGQVALWLRREGDHGAAFSVTDCGRGITPEELPHIFERFRKNMSEFNRNGSGLGLAIALHIAKRHGIEITAASRPGVETVFTFHFPSVCLAPSQTIE